MKALDMSSVKSGRAARLWAVYGVGALAGIGAAIAFGSISPEPVKAHNWLGQCTVNFDNLFALTNMRGNARDTFANRTKSTANGPVLCSNVNDPLCFIYRHRCFNNYIHVDEITGYNHFHLGFSAPGFNPLCGFVNPNPNDGFGAGFGKTVNGQCTLPDWKREPRSELSAHEGSHWIRIRLATQAGVERVFDMNRIRFGGTTPVWLRFRKANNAWFGWFNLSPGNYDMSAHMHDVYEVQARSASGYIPPVQIVDFDILD